MWNLFELFCLLESLLSSIALPCSIQAFNLKLQKAPCTLYYNLSLTFNHFQKVSLAQMK